MFNLSEALTIKEDQELPSEYKMVFVISGKKLYVVHTDAMYFLSNFT